MSRNAAPRRILIIKLGALGDFFLAQTAFAGLRAHHAGDHLTLLTLPSLAGMARSSGLFDDVQEDPRGRTIGDWLRIRRILRGGCFDLVYDLQAQSRTDRYHLLFFPGPWPQWSGTARFASHPDRYPGRRKVPVIERYARQLAPFGVSLPESVDLSWLDADTAPYALGYQPYALLIPGSSPGRPDKRWPAEKYGELADLLAGKGVRAIIIGGAAEQPLARTIRATRPDAVDLTGRTDIPQLAGLARRAWGVAGNDTGPTHLAAAVGATTVALFCYASDPVHLSGPRAVIHHRPDFADMDAGGVLAALIAARGRG
jgi:ADP-heptose:LPS heptosyltransferase